MEIRIYDRDMDLVGLTESQTSFQWTRKYNDVGSFELHVPLTEDNVALMKMGRLVTYRGANEAGIIEDIRFKSTQTLRELEIKGRFLESYMSRRIMPQTIHYNGTIENAMYKLFEYVEEIPYVDLASPKGLEPTIEFQATYKGLLDYEMKLAKQGTHGFRMKPNFTDKKITFEVYDGVDRSNSQTEHSFVEFSDRFDNIYDATYRENSQLYKNVAYIGGEGEGSQRVFTSVGDLTSTGYDRYEMWVDAKDLRSENITQEQYIENLKTRGRERLEEQLYSRAFTCRTNNAGNFIYKRDYDLGDIITIRKVDWGVSDDLRIVEINEIYETQEVEIELTFGSPLPDMINWEDL